DLFEAACLPDDGRDLVAPGVDRAFLDLHERADAFLLSVPRDVELFPAPRAGVGGRVLPEDLQPDLSLFRHCLQASWARPSPSTRCFTRAANEGADRGGSAVVFPSGPRPPRAS